MLIVKAVIVNKVASFIKVVSVNCIEYQSNVD